MNTGGRVVFEKESRVRYLQIDGSVSKEVYVVFSENISRDVRSDRKGLITLKQENGQKLIKVHARRILPLSVDGKSPVIQSTDKYRTICPECGIIHGFIQRPNEDKLDCQCGSTIYLYWIGDTPKPIEKLEKAMSEEQTTPATPVPPVIEAKPKRTPKQTSAVKIDLANFANAKNCLLYTKKNIKFDHVEVDVQAHVLLLNEPDGCKKFCFNTYDGTLGKKSKGLPFIVEEDESGHKSIVIVDASVWFNVKDQTKATAKLIKDGYANMSLQLFDTHTIS